MTPRTVAHQAPLSMEFSRQQYWSGLPLASPGNLPNPGSESGSPALHRLFTDWATREDLQKAKHQRTDACKLWCWRRSLRVSWTARRPNQSILKEINPEYSLDRLMLKLKLQYFGHLMWRPNSLEKTWCWETLRQEEKAVAEDEMVGWYHWINRQEFEQTLGQWRTGKPGVLQSVGSQRVRHDLATEQQWNTRLGNLPRGTQCCGSWS